MAQQTPDLNKLEAKFEALFKEETEESFNKWLADKQQQSLNKNNMAQQTIQTWLSNVIYDEHGTQIFNKDADGNIQLVVDIRGWGRLQNEFKTASEAADFQDEVGRFITEAIREKIETLNQNK